jgi:TolB protein
MDGPDFEEVNEPVPTPVSRARRAMSIAIVLALVVSMVALAFVSGRGVVTAPPRGGPSAVVAPAGTDASRIAVIDAGGGLSTTDTVGGSVVRYGEPGIRFSFPTWSPDGTRFAVIAERSGDTAIHVFTRPAGDGTAADPVVVYNSAERPPFYAYWSPDGRSLAFLTTEPNGLALRIAPADGSTPATVIREGSPIYWAWADPSRLLVHSGGEGLAGFFGEIRRDGVATEPAAVLAGAFRVPAASEDGRFRAFVAPGEATPQRIVVESRDRATSHAVDVFGVAAIAFGRGSDELAFIAPAGEGRDTVVPVGPLRLLDATSGAVRTLLDSTVIGFFWAPDGKTIAALEVPAPGEDKIASIGRASLISTSSAWDVAAEGPKLRLAFVDVGSGTIRSHWGFNVSEVFVNQVLPYFDQYALSHRMWSPDSTSIVIPVLADGTDQVMGVPVDGSGARKVADGVAGFWSP